METKNVDLKIHKLTKEQYERELEAGNIDEYALYLTPDEEIDLSPYATKDEVNAKADSDHNHDTSYDTKGSADAALSEAKEYTDSRAVNPDWNQSDSTAKDYIKNRIIYKDKSVGSVIASGTMPTDYDPSSVNILTQNDETFTGFIEGESYVVTIDGVTTEHIAGSPTNSAFIGVYIANFDLSAFDGTLPDDSWYVCYLDEIGEPMCNATGSYLGKNISIASVTYDIKKLPTDLLPDVRLGQVTTSGNGSAYTATVDDITALTAGVNFVMLPHVVSTTTMPTLNVNNLGAKYIRRRLSTATGTTVVGSAASWITAKKPIQVVYDGTYWVVDLVRPSASDIYGALPITSGGTGGTSVETALANLGLTTETWTFTLADGNTVTKAVYVG